MERLKAEALKIGIEFEQETIDKIDELLEKIKTLNIEIEKLNSSNITGVNNITINVSTLGYDEIDIQETAQIIKNILDKKNEKANSV